MSNSFERALFGEYASIPVHEAGAFFMSMRRPVVKTAARRLTKTAGWQDPPDETGVFEGQFEVPVEHAVALMGNCAMMLLRLMNAGLIYSKSIRGPYAEAVRHAIRHSKYDHQSAFEYVIERMTVLLGAPHVPDVDMPPPSIEPIAVAQRMIRAEQEMINSYHELINVLGKNPMREKVKCFMGHCQEHLDSYWMAIPPEYGEKSMQPQPPVMLARHEEHETPEQEAIESPEFEAAEQAVGVEPPEHTVPKTAGMSLKKIAALLVKTARDGVTDAELKEVGRQRAVTNISAEHHREAARRGERAAGMLAGAAGGGALAHRLSGGKSLATLGGAALGGIAGRHVGGEIGTEADIARHKTASVVKQAAARLVAWVKQADDTAAGTPDAEAPMASPTDNQELAPVNYMNAELMGQRLQNRNEAAYYHQQVQAAQAQAQQAQMGAQQQVQEIRQQAAQAMQDAAMADTKVKAALDEATRARDDALKQTETAARMRMATQNLRMQLIQLASVDPVEQAALDLAMTTGGATAAMQPPAEAGAVMQAPDGSMIPDAGLAGGPPNPPAAGEGGGGPPGGPAGAAPALQTAPGAAPPAGSPDMNANAGPPPGPDPSTASSLLQMSNKTSAVRRRMRKTAEPGIGFGAGLLAGGAYGALDTLARAHAGLDPVHSRIAALEGAQNGSYGQAAALANAKSELAQRTLAMQHPARVAAGNALSCAMWGGNIGNALEQGARNLHHWATKPAYEK